MEKFKFTQTGAEMQAIIDKAAAMPSAAAVQQVVDAETVASVTYSELTVLIAEEALIPGRRYRITDYVTIVSNPTGPMGQALPYGEFRSAGHPFDIIVTANSTNSLDEDADAAVHEGDDYFANSDLSKWKLKYSIENNARLFIWASDTGKGVIYDMIDERGNHTGYDFKNIQFKRHQMVNPGTLTPYYQEVSQFYNGLRGITNNSNVNWHCFKGYFSEAAIYERFGDTFSTSISPTGSRMFVLIDDTDGEAIIAEVDEAKWFYTFNASLDFDGEPSDASMISTVRDVEIEPFNFLGTWLLSFTVCSLSAVYDGGFDGTRVKAMADTIVLSNGKTIIKNAVQSYVSMLFGDADAEISGSVVSMRYGACAGTVITRSIVDLDRCNLTGAILTKVWIEDVHTSTIYGALEDIDVDDATNKFIGTDSNGVVKVFNPADLVS